MPRAPENLVATVTASFGVRDEREAAAIADELLDADNVSTVRIGMPGERSVYRVDLPAREVARHRELALAPAQAIADAHHVEFEVLRIATSCSGLGDPEGEAPAPGTTPFN